MGSSSAKRPSSNSIKAATVVTGLVIEAIRKIVSRSTGRLRRQIAAPDARGLRDASAPPHQGRGTGELSGVYIRSKRGFNRILVRHAPILLAARAYAGIPEPVGIPSPNKEPCANASGHRLRHLFAK